MCSSPSPASPPSNDLSKRRRNAMSTTALRDSQTMLRRNLKHALRYPGLTIGALMVPIIFLLLFVYVLGGALSTGIGTGTDYINYLAPGIILMTVAAASTTTAVSVCTD